MMNKRTQHDPWHPDAFLQNQWTCKYRVLVEVAQSENRVRVPFEHAIHHIVPKSFYRSYCADGWLDGDWDAPENRVLLTHREHAQCHIWLWERMTTGVARRKMVLAVHRMLIGRSKKESVKVSVAVLTRIMRDATLAISEMQRGRPKPNLRDNTVRTWADQTGRTFIGTREEAECHFGLKSGQLQHLLGKNSKRTAHGIWIVGPNDDQFRPPKVNAQPKLLDKQIREWGHIDGRTFVGTRSELEASVNLRGGALWGLVRKKNPRKTLHGWYIVIPDMEPPVKGAQYKLRGRSTNRPSPNRDSTIRTWAHHDGRVFTGTRWDAEDYFGLKHGAMKMLVCKKPFRTAHNVFVINATEQETL